MLTVWDIISDTIRIYFYFDGKVGFYDVYDDKTTASSLSDFECLEDALAFYKKNLEWAIVEDLT